MFGQTAIHPIHRETLRRRPVLEGLFLLIRYRLRRTGRMFSYLVR
jgi:hypothetical protein